MKSYEAGKVKGRVREPWRASGNCIQVEVWVELDNTDTQDGKHLRFPQLLSLPRLVLYTGFISSPSERPISHGQFFSKIDTAPLQLLFYSLLRTRFRSLADRGFLRPPWDQSCWEAPYKCKSLPLWRKELETPFSKGSGCTLHFILPAWQILHSPYPGSAKDCIISRAPSQHAQLIAVQVLFCLTSFSPSTPSVQKAVTLWLHSIDVCSPLNRHSLKCLICIKNALKK